MKKFMIIFSMGAAIAALTSCSSKSSDVTEFEIRETLKSTSKSYELKQSDGSTAYLTISASAQWPEKLGNADLINLQDSIIGLYKVKDGYNINEALTAYVDNTSIIEGADVKKVDSVPASTADTFCYDIKLDTRITELTESTVTYEASAYSFTGGAHPNWATFPFTYDLASGKVIDKAWLFGTNETTDTALLSVIKDGLLAKLGQQTYDELYSDDTFPITVSNSVYLSEGNIIFHYNPYEIAPYALGAIDIEVSPYSVSSLLTPAAKAMLIN